MGTRDGARQAWLGALALAMAGAVGTSLGCEPSGGTSALPTLDGAAADQVAFHDAGHDAGGGGVAGQDAGPSDGGTDEAGDAGAAQDAAAVDTPAPDAPPADALPTDGQSADVADGAQGGDAGAPPSPTGTLGGGVLLAEVDSPQLNMAVAGARFTPPEPAPQGSAVGPCLVAFSDPNAPAAPGYGFDAGVITVPATSPTVVLTPTPEGAAGTGYTSNIPSSQQDLLPGGGGLVQVKAAGGQDLGPFVVTLQAPQQITVFQPTLGFGASASTAFDVTVTWDGATGPGAGQKVVVNVAPLDGNYQVTAGQAATCEITGDPGSLVIPAEALALVRGDAASLNVALGVSRVREGTAAVGAATVRATLTRSSGGLLQLTP